MPPLRDCWGWHPIGPDVPGFANKIPAQVRYEGGGVPPGDTTPAGRPQEFTAPMR